MAVTGGGGGAHVCGVAGGGGGAHVCVAGSGGAHVCGGVVVVPTCVAVALAVWWWWPRVWQWQAALVGAHVCGSGRRCGGGAHVW